MNNTLILALLLAINGLTCWAAYLIGKKEGLHRGYLRARTSRLKAAAK